MKIYIVNKFRYDIGEIRGNWFDLPVDLNEVIETIFDSEELDAYGIPLYDYAIINSELPFKVFENEDISVLNKMFVTIESKVNLIVANRILKGSYTLKDVISFASALNYKDLLQFISSKELKKILKRKRKRNSSLKSKMQEVSYLQLMKDNYFVKAKDGNYRVVTEIDLKDTLDFIFERLRKDCTPVTKLFHASL